MKGMKRKIDILVEQQFFLRNSAFNVDALYCWGSFFGATVSESINKNLNVLQSHIDRLKRYSEKSSVAVKDKRRFRFNNSTKQWDELYRIN